MSLNAQIHTMIITLVFMLTWSHWMWNVVQTLAIYITNKAKVVSIFYIVLTKPQCHKPISRETKILQGRYFIFFTVDYISLNLRYTLPHNRPYLFKLEIYIITWLHFYDSHEMLISSRKHIQVSHKTLVSLWKHVHVSLKKLVSLRKIFMFLMKHSFLTNTYLRFSRDADLITKIYPRLSLDVHFLMNT